MYKLNQRVITHKYGPGTIIVFERVTFNAVQSVNEYQEGDRIGVQLDTPENWMLHTRGLPYFVPGDIA